MQPHPLPSYPQNFLVLLFSNKINTSKHNCEAVVLMAGGNGKRLAPLTNLRPKPLLEVGPRPLLETTIKRFISRGFTNFWLSINYLGEMIEDHFQDGLKFGANIKYLRESYKAILNAQPDVKSKLLLITKVPDNPFDREELANSIQSLKEDMQTYDDLKTQVLSAFQDDSILDYVENNEMIKDIVSNSSNISSKEWKLLNIFINEDSKELTDKARNIFKQINKLQADLDLFIQQADSHPKFFSNSGFFLDILYLFYLKFSYFCICNTTTPCLRTYHTVNRKFYILGISYVTMF